MANCEAIFAALFLPYAYLSVPQWRGKTWNELKEQAVVPADSGALAAFFAKQREQRSRIESRLDEIASLDAQIDEQALDLYGIVSPADRQPILGNAPPVGDEETKGEAE